MGVSRGEIGMSQVKSLVTIKGTKDGLIFLLDDRCSFDQLIEDLREKLSSDYYKSEKNDPIVYVQIDLGNRLLTKSDQETIESIITSNSHLRVHHYHSNVVTVEKAKAMQEEVQTATLTRMIRSGQIVKMKGNVLLIGDVNPGGCLMATGNIYIMGALKGKLTPVITVIRVPLFVRAICLQQAYIFMNICFILLIKQLKMLRCRRYLSTVRAVK